MSMPVQKPGRSEQVVGTPTVFLEAVKRRLGIRSFAIDLAATPENAVAELFFDAQTDSLTQEWWRFCGRSGDWGWLNPPFDDISPWAGKCWRESQRGAHIALLVPAAPGSQWWVEFVRGRGYVTELQGRITFIGHQHGYPKDLALVLYAPYLEGGSCGWRWQPPKARRRIPDAALTTIGAK